MSCDGPAGERYDSIGRTYTTTRRADPRIAARIERAIGGAAAVVNVGAGSGSYEPPSCVAAVEPSDTMLSQRRAGAAPALRGIAEALPLRDGAVDVALATLTVHHWTDLETGLSEMRRVAGRQVIFYFEFDAMESFWLLEYVPGIAADPSERGAPGAEAIAGTLDVRETQVVPVPADCIDGFGAAYWARPEEYLRREVQAGMSCLARRAPGELEQGMRRLADDLESGEWDRTYGHLRTQESYDGGLRLAICGGG